MFFSPSGIEYKSSQAELAEKYDIDLSLVDAVYQSPIIVNRSPAYYSVTVLYKDERKAQIVSGIIMQDFNKLFRGIDVINASELKLTIAGEHNLSIESNLIDLQMFFARYDIRIVNTDKLEDYRAGIEMVDSQLTVFVSINESEYIEVRKKLAQNPQVFKTLWDKPIQESRDEYTETNGIIDLKEDNNNRMSI